MVIAIRQEQLDATHRLFSKLRHWNASEKALGDLRNSFPEGSHDAWLLKCAAVNWLYNTNVLAIARMATHVHDVVGGNFQDGVERLSV